VSRSARCHLPGKCGARAARPRCLACTPWRHFDIFADMPVLQCAPGARAGDRARRSAVLPIFHGPQGRTKNRRRRRRAEPGNSFLHARAAGVQGCKCRLRCAAKAMRRGGVRLRLPDVDPRRRARSCDTGSRRPHGCRALSCAHRFTRHACGDVGLAACRARGADGLVRVCTALSRASRASEIALACLNRSALECGQTLVPTG